MENSKEKQELDNMLQELKKLRKPKNSKEIVDAVIDEIQKNEDINDSDDIAARPQLPEEHQPQQ